MIDLHIISTEVIEHPTHDQILLITDLPGVVEPFDQSLRLSFNVPKSTGQSYLREHLGIAEEPIKQFYTELNDGQEIDENIKQTVYRLIHDCLGVELNRIQLNSHFQSDLGADSLDMVELVMMAEQEFGLEIPEDTAEYAYESDFDVARAIRFIQANVR